MAYRFFTGNSRYWVRILQCWTISTNKVYTTNITVLRTHKRVTAMTCFYPLLPSLVLCNSSRKMEKLYWNTAQVFFPGFRISGIIFTSAISASLSRDHSVRILKCEVLSNFRGLFSSEVTWHYMWNLAPKRWVDEVEPLWLPQCRSSRFCWIFKLGLRFLHFKD